MILFFLINGDRGKIIKKILFLSKETLLTSKSLLSKRSWLFRSLLTLNACSMSTPGSRPVLVVAR